MTTPSIPNHNQGDPLRHKDPDDEYDVEWLLDVLSKEEAGTSEKAESSAPGSEKPSCSLNQGVPPGAGDGVGSTQGLPDPLLDNSDPPPSIGASSPATDTLPLIIPIITSNLNLTLPTSSNRVLLLDQPVSFACNSCTESFSDASQLVDHIEASHYQGRRYQCSKCNADFGLKKDLQRHFETTEAHRLSAIQCRCSQSFGRKDKFCEHLQRKKPCDPVIPFLCFCGHRIESSSPDSIYRILEHVKPCGQRKRGRPKK